MELKTCELCGKNYVGEHCNGCTGDLYFCKKCEKGMANPTLNIDGYCDECAA